jgi:hypothetical protein
MKADRRLTPLLDRYARDGKVSHQEARSLQREVKRGDTSGKELRQVQRFITRNEDRFETVPDRDRLARLVETRNDHQTKWSRDQDPEVRVNPDAGGPVLDGRGNPVLGRDGQPLTVPKGHVVLRDRHGDPILKENGEPVTVRDGDVAIQNAGSENGLLYAWAHYDNSKVRTHAEFARRLKDGKISKAEARKLVEWVRGEGGVSPAEREAVRDYLQKAKKDKKLLEPGARKILEKVLKDDVLTKDELQALKDGGGFVRPEDLDRRDLKEKFGRIRTHEPAVAGNNGRPSGNIIGEYVVTPQPIALENGDTKGLFFPARSSDPDAKPYAADNYGDRGGNWANLLWNLPDQPAGGAVRSILQSSDRFFLSDHPKRTMPAYIQGPDGKPQLAARVTFAYGYVKADNGEKIWGWRVWQHEVKQADNTWKKVEHQQKV